MALIKCIECGKEISDKAEACPNCGFRLEDSISEERKSVSKEAESKTPELSRGDKILSFVLLFGLLGLLYFGISYIFSDDNEKQQKIEAPKEIVVNSAWDGSVSQVVEYLKSNLKDPNSYESIEWTPVQKNNRGYFVRHKYRAKNSFGGYSVESYIFYLDSAGNVYNTLEWK